MDAMVEQMVELRKGKMTPEQCRDALKKGNYFGTMLVKMGVADCLLGGATCSTADTVRPALQLIKTKPGSNIVSSCFIMVRPAASGENEVLAMADCAINIKPTEDELVEICRETNRVREDLRRRSQGRFPELLHARLRQGRGRRQDAQRLWEGQGQNAQHPIGGEFQFDAAVSPVVAKTKHISDSVSGHANTFIFPDINAGSIGYKIAQRLGNFDAYGPILLGLNATLTTSPAAATRRRSIRWPLLLPLWRKRNKTVQQGRRAALLFSYYLWLLSLFSRLKRSLFPHLSADPANRTSRNTGKDFRKLQKRVHFALECVDQQPL